MKMKAKTIILDSVIVIQCLFYLITSMRIAVIFTLLITCILYDKIKNILVRFTIVLIYCTAVFILFSLYTKKFSTDRFFGISYKNTRNKNDIFFHNNVVYLALLSNKHITHKVKAFIQTFNNEIKDTIKAPTLSSIININDLTAYGNICIAHNSNRLVYINSKLVAFDKAKHTSLIETMDDLEIKSLVLSNLKISSRESILFGVKIPESDSFWCGYNKLKDKYDMMRCIILRIGLKMELLDTKYEYAIFYSDTNLGIQRFHQKNELKLDI